jgi:uncharacterized membrane protein
MTVSGLIDQVLLPLATVTRLLLECLSVLTVLAGLLATAALALPHFKRRLPRRRINRARLNFGSWLALALEFQLGADIVYTSISPTGQHLIQLAVVAVIRTLLNGFLAREISAEEALEQNTTRLQATPVSTIASDP